MPRAALATTLVLATTFVAAATSSVLAQEVPKDSPSPVLDACRDAALANLKEKGSEVREVTIDPDATAVTKADTSVGDIPIRSVAIGEAYLGVKGTDKPYRFVCLVSTGGKVVMTFFTRQ